MFSCWGLQTHVVFDPKESMETMVMVARVRTVTTQLRTLTLVAPWHNLMCVPATLGAITEIQTWQVTVDGVNHGVLF
jgi:hypothetical protein